MTLDKRLIYGPHLKSKRRLLNNRQMLRPILKSKLSISSKLLLYESKLRPIWTYKWTYLFYKSGEVLNYHILAT